MTDTDSHSPSYRELSIRTDNRTAAAQIATQARRSLAMFTRDLEAPIYDVPEFLDAARALALRSRYSRIRIVVIDPTSAIKDGHRLIELARRLSSYIEVRRPSEDHAKLADAFLIGDDIALLYRPLASRYEGFADLYTPVAARGRLSSFEDIWGHGEPEPEFRRLGV
ncbi:MAG: hypothetical protein ACRETQ_01150 [Gammaproteobacteria bacterium]